MNSSILRVFAVVAWAGLLSGVAGCAADAGPEDGNAIETTDSSHVAPAMNAPGCAPDQCLDAQNRCVTIPLGQPRQAVCATPDDTR
jgi:hypothetical protein